MHVLAFRHAPLEGIGTIAAALDRHHIACHTVDTTTSHGELGSPLEFGHFCGADPRADPLVRAGPPGPAGELGSPSHGGLILMGGPMSVNDNLPWIPHEIAAIREAVHRGIPVLGVCLGAQLIARALGARVYPNPAKEIGWSPLHWTPAAATDPLFHGLWDPEMVFQWHGETFDLPPGAEHLAHSAACRHQAFRFGGNVYGIQFHLEVTPPIIEDWLRQDATCGDLCEAAAPIDPYAYASRLAEVAATVFDRWCCLIH